MNGSRRNRGFVLPARARPFAWRDGNGFELLIDGTRFFPRMLEAIERARRYVLFEIYLFESGAVAARFIDALARAAARGVAVKLLLDAFGAHKLVDRDRERLRRAGVDLQFYNPFHLRNILYNLFRDHRKLLVVDGEIAFVSGAGVTDEFDSRSNPQRNWRDTAVAIRGPVLIDWVELFRRVWQRPARNSMAPPPAAPVSPAGAMRGRVGTNSAFALQDIKRALLRHLLRAERCAWISTGYFVPSRKLLRVLKHAARRGVDVRLLLPGPYTDHSAVRIAGHRYYGRLLRNGVRIFEYQPRFLHAKSVRCDDWVSIGSSNHDRWNLRWNLEANQEIDDGAFAAEVGAMFEADFRLSSEILYADWRRRPWRTRLRERWWGRVDMWLERLHRFRRPRGDE